MRQPECQSYKGAEHEEVVKGKAPDPQLPQGFHLLKECLGLAAGPLCGQGIFLGQKNEGDTHDCQHRGVDLCGAFPAECHQQEGGAEVGYCRAHVTRPENAQRCALVLRFKPGRRVGHPHDKSPACQAHTQGTDQQHEVGRSEGEQIHAGGGGQHQNAEYPATAIPVCPYAEE